MAAWRSRAIRALGVALAWLALGGAAAAQQAAGTLPLGQVVQDVRVSAQQSYALYLPIQYTPQRRWPVLFVFDPAARGAAAVEVFAAAAEKHGVIVLGSNTSRNGPSQPQMQAFAAMLEDAQRRFAVDTSRLYAAGFSGGARVAGLAGFLCDGCIAGVIACGAGLPQGMTAQQQAQLPPYYFTAGEGDFNYFEVLDAARALRHTARHVAVFDGGHQWPPAEVATSALGWLLTRKRDAKATLSSVPTLPRREEQKARQQQQALVRELARYLGEAARSAEDREQNLGDARSELARLYSRRQRAKGADAVILRRALGEGFALAYEGGQRLARQNEPALAAAFFQIATEAVPDNPELRYQAAAQWAAAGERARALAALRQAVDLGFKDHARLQSDAQFAALRESREFEEIVRAAKAR